MESIKYTVLIVDDEEPARNLVDTFLTRLGHRCVKATDGVDALVKMKANKIDAIITDIKMPKMDGIRLTKEILKQYPGLPIMVITGVREENTAEGAISAGAREFIQKPFSGEELTIRFNKMVKESQIIRHVKSDGGEEDIRDLLCDLEAALSPPQKVVYITPNRL